MPGIEIAGLIMGALPLIIKAVDAYRDGFRSIATTFNKRQHVAKLARALRLQQHTLEEFIKSIALASGFEDALALDDDPLSCLNRRDVQDQVEGYLGTKNTSILIEELKTNSEAVGKVARCISGLLPGLEGPRDNILAIIKANQDKPSLIPDLGPRLKLVLGITDIKELTQEIDRCSNALEYFSKLVLSNYQPINSKSSRRSQKLAKALRQVRGLAGVLYDGILGAYSDGCHDCHEARLYLDDRIEIAQQAPRRRGAASTETPVTMFDLVLHTGGQQTDTLYYGTAVRVFDGIYLDNVNNEFCSTTGPAETPFAWSSAKDSSDSKPKIDTITDICTTIKDAHAMNTHLSFALLGSTRIYAFVDNKVIPASRPLSQEYYGNFISLSQILKTSANTLPWKPRLQLALILTSSLLQLLQTPWLTQAWRKDAVFFLVSDRPPSPSSHERIPRFDLSRPFIVCNFSGKPPEVRPIETRAVLLELGIILLEIWHGITFEAHFGLDDSDTQSQSTTYLGRLAQALEWEAEWANPMPGLFGEAVSQCLRRNNASVEESLDWEDFSVWSSICGDIIEPLSKLYKNF